MERMRISKTDRNYFLSALALVVYGAYNTVLSHTDNGYYYVVAAVVACLGFFRGTLIGLTRGWCSEGEVVLLTLGGTMAGYGIYDWFSKRIFDFEMLSLAAISLSLGAFRVSQRKKRRR